MIRPMPKKKNNLKPKSVFTTNFNKLIADRNLSVRMAADLLELPYSTVADYTTGASPTNLEAIGKFCKKLGVSFSWLMLSEEPSNRTQSLTLESLFDEQSETSFEGIYKIITRAAA